MSAQSVRCPSCGNENEAGMSFCTHCGAPLATLGQPPPTAPPAPHTAYPVRRTSSRTWLIPAACITCVALIFVAGFIGIMAAIALPNYLVVKEKAKEAEVKANMHNIQLSVERFAVDTEGAYPNYLIGGEARHAAVVSDPATTDVFTRISECASVKGVSDPLLRRGYINSYPSNPFARDGGEIHRMQEKLTSSIYGADALRNGPDGEGAQLGTRFGPLCTSMGSVLADARLRGQTWIEVDLDAGTYEERMAWADVEYEFWDVWQADEPRPFLPGMFFYKGLGPIVSIGNPEAEEAPIMPTEVDQYILGAYGGIRTKGSDVLGEELPVQYFMQDDPATVFELWPLTRSEVSDDPNDRQGSPYGQLSGAGQAKQVYEINSNGVRDAIVLVLTAGADIRHVP